ncbi:MAG: hypothetical protein LM514_04975, partial [Streptococcus sp.]|nr:hypothetical protein [Streptococcus sp.]
MAEKPLLILPTPERINPPRGRGGGGQLRLPDKRYQVSRFGPIFNRLREVLGGNTTGAMELRDDPSSLAPDRVIVFEIAGTVSEFVRAVSKVPGLEFMAEYETEEEPDELFAEVDKRKGKGGLDRTDKNVGGRFYLAMPDVSALRQLLSLWDRWARNEDLGTGYAPFKHVFAQLRRLRPWGAEDRISDETISYWKEETAREPDRPVRTEVELWFHENQARRQQSSQ